MQTPQPTILPLNRDGLPLDDLRPYPHALTWKMEWRDGKDDKPGSWTKVPYNPRTGAKARPNQPATWGAVNDVLSTYDQFGFVVWDDDPFVFLDLDKSWDRDNDCPKQWAAEIMSNFPGTYWERSVSGTGIKGLVRGQIPRNRQRSYGDGQIEIYSRAKFTVLTGHQLPNSCGRITDGQWGLDSLYSVLFPENDTPRPMPTGRSDVDDTTAIERVRKMPRGRPLFETGDIGLYNNDHSVADFAMLGCFIYAGVTDAGQLDRLYQRSALYPNQPNWKERNYRERTIANALDGTIRPGDWIERDEGAWLIVTPQSTGDKLSPVTDDYREALQYLCDAVVNTNITRNELIAFVSTIQAAMRKPKNGNGHVTVSAAEISHDWRRKADPGGNTPQTNPNGEVPRMARSRVAPTLTTLVEKGLIDARPMPDVKKTKNGTTFTATDWEVARPESLAQAFAPLATYEPEEQKVRKQRTITRPCGNCGEIHAHTRYTYCGSADDPGCGAQIGEPFVIEPVREEEITGDNLSPDMGANFAPIYSQGGYDGATEPEISGDNLSPVRNHAENGEELSWKQ